MSKQSKEKRKSLAEWKSKQRKGAEDELPASLEVLLTLFDELDKQLSVAACDHSLKFTLAWAHRVGIDPDRTVYWARQYGGFCDCEVLANVQDANPAFRGSRR
jgi:hypothetical protein